MPSRTIVKATSGWMPTITVSAPRNRAISAMRAQGQGGERVDDVEGGDVDDDAARAVLADLLDEVVLEADQLGVVQGSVDRCDQGAIPVAGSTRAPVRRSRAVASPSFRVTRVAEQPLGLFEPTLQVADGVHLAQVDPDGHEGLGDLG